MIADVSSDASTAEEVLDKVFGSADAATTGKVFGKDELDEKLAIPPVVALDGCTFVVIAPEEVLGVLADDDSAPDRLLGKDGAGKESSPVAPGERLCPVASCLGGAGILPPQWIRKNVANNNKRCNRYNFIAFYKL